MPDLNDSELLDLLRRLTPTQLDGVILRAGLPRDQIAPDNAQVAQRAADIVTLAQQAGPTLRARIVSAVENEAPWLLPGATLSTAPASPAPDNGSGGSATTSPDVPRTGFSWKSGVPLSVLAIAATLAAWRAASTGSSGTGAVDAKSSAGITPPAPARGDRPPDPTSRPDHSGAACSGEGWVRWSPTAPRTFTPKSANQVVIESRTGLAWEGHTTATLGKSYEEARAYCASLSLGERTTGWRLPTRIELLSLVDYKLSVPAVDPALKALLNAPYWTSSDYADGSQQKWAVWLGDGSTSPRHLTKEQAWVRCVNGTPPQADLACPRYVLTDDTATDKETKLVWQRSAAQRQATHAEAIAACAGLRTGGRTWRLPEVEELASLIAERRKNPSGPHLDEEAFPPNIEPNGYYWARTDYAARPEGAGWKVGFYDGVIVMGQKHEPSFYRCVSGP